MGRGRTPAGACLGVAVLFLAAAGGAAAAEGPEAGEALLYMVPAFTGDVRGHCAGRLEPELAVISGGISAESVKPTRAHEEIDRRLEAIRRYVGESGGRLVVKERLRAIRNPRPSDDRVADQPDPFVAVQLVDVELPAGAAVDPILDRLLLLGLDRFGTDLDARVRGTGAPVVVVSYRFRDLRRRLDELVGRCRSEVLAAWCDREVPAPFTDRCRRELAALEERFQTRSLSLSSQPVAVAGNRTMSLQFPYPWRQHDLSRVELLGRAALELGGSLSLRAALPPR